MQHLSLTDLTIESTLAPKPDFSKYSLHGAHHCALDLLLDRLAQSPSKRPLIRTLSLRRFRLPIPPRLITHFRQLGLQVRAHSVSFYVAPRALPASSTQLLLGAFVPHSTTTLLFPQAIALHARATGQPFSELFWATLSLQLTRRILAPFLQPYRQHLLGTQPASQLHLRFTQLHRQLTQLSPTTDWPQLESLTQQLHHTESQLSQFHHFISQKSLLVSAIHSFIDPQHLQDLLSQCHSPQPDSPTCLVQQLIRQHPPTAHFGPQSSLHLVSVRQSLFQQAQKTYAHIAQHCRQLQQSPQPKQP